MAIKARSRTAKLIASPIASAHETIGVLTPGCRVIGVNKCQFSLIDLVMAVIEQIGPSDLTISTWTPGKAEMESVFRLLKTHEITRFRLLVDRSFLTRQPQYVAHLQKIAGVDSLRQMRTHAKFALISASDYRITIRTSMNFNRNTRLEQFDLDDDPAIYAFFEKVIDEIFTIVPPGLTASGSQINAAFNGLRLGSEAGTVTKPKSKAARTGGNGFQFTGFRFGR